MDDRKTARPQLTGPIPYECDREAPRIMRYRDDKPRVAVYLNGIARF
jgi:hypothetical protein